MAKIMESELRHIVFFQNGRYMRRKITCLLPIMLGCITFGVGITFSLLPPEVISAIVDVLCRIFGNTQGVQAAIMVTTGITANFICTRLPAYKAINGKEQDAVVKAVSGVSLVTAGFLTSVIMTALLGNL